MKTIQITIDEPLLSEVDRVIEEMQTTRSAFIRQVLEEAVKHYHVRSLEQQQAEGYARHPVQPGEFDGWEDEQAWGQS
ncbi:MAG: ribbon-helix-helix domain-containing protein [Chloroflexota bacterium]